MKTRDSLSFYVAWIAVVVAFCVVLLGAFTRLKDAGLGCPDWPGCYGQITVPIGSQQLLHAEFLFPHKTVDSTKAWIEMIHRYAAGVVGVLIIILAIQAIRRCHMEKQPIALPFLLLALVIFQALLGRWTVTLKLLPLVVMSHLLGGMLIFSLLCLLVIELGGYFKDWKSKGVYRFRPWITIGLIIVFLQIILGGWTSAHYAALACLDFPFCHGDWIPQLDFSQAFSLWNYHVSNEAKMTIQFTHRLVGAMTFLYITGLAAWMTFAHSFPFFRRLGAWLFILILLQLSLGILNVLLMLPLPVALAHNAVATVLLAFLTMLNYSLYAKR